MEQLSYYKKETKEFVCTTSFFETEEMNSTTTIYNGNFVKPIFDNGFWLEGATQLEITNSLNYPKIIKYQFDRSKDFRTIDHNTELIVALKSKEICGTDISNRGLLIKKEYFYDNELIFFIDYAYRFDDVGQISEQSLILKWLNENNQVNNLIKDKGFVPFSKNEMRVAVRKQIGRAHV